MPLHTFTCTDCNHVTEEIFSISELIPTTYDCEVCGHTAAYNFPVHAKTSGRWGDGHSAYDAGLGMVIENSMHREKVLKEKGLVPIEDLGSHWEDDRAETIKRQHEKDVKFDSTYQENLNKHGGDAIEAMAETLPASDIVAGKFDD